MAVYSCLRCRVFLTCRPPEARDREYCFPHADDFRGCEVCGTMLCEPCAAEVGPGCPECGGRLHPGQRFEPTGVFRLPPVLRRLATAEERIAWVGRMWDRGVLASGEREWLLRVIAELADPAGGRAERLARLPGRPMRLWVGKSRNAARVRWSGLFGQGR
jgi:hypothetical protein